MPIGTCTGPANKDRICREYVVTPVLHLRTLVGETKRSCAGGRPVETSYYMFEAQHRETRIIEIFYAGKTAARGFLGAIPAAPLPCFNPLLDGPSDDDLGRAPGDPGDRGARNGPVPQRTALNRELFQATRLFVCWLPTEPRAALSSVIREIEARPGDSRLKSLAQSLNTMLGSYGRPLRKMIQDLERRGNRVRPYAFPHVVQAVVERGLSNYIDP
ncbi:hypothetical protein FFK22_028515 [Mycobacterium sp. KBS0706]|uniref:hypothetical protein n=1 Tax=Mycobacterium sp. KBS0706 TaxID=2578109 RepID=UPI00110F9B13|nr:hypothetical protein [Mycobacterium sp. KBS0706]TSD85258.1 hypothetical protein FFK22_028515 [Mycobacterium sp. KBS0706]